MTTKDNILCERVIGSGWRKLGVIVSVAGLAYTGLAPSGHAALLKCKGHEGATKYQGVIPFRERIIPTDSASEVVASIDVRKDRVVIEGNSHWVSGTYGICADRGESLWFAPVAYAGCDRTDEFGDLGVLNKVTGDLRYHVGDYLALLSCSKAEALLP